MCCGGCYGCYGCGYGCGYYCGSCCGSCCGWWCWRRLPSGRSAASASACARHTFWLALAWLIFGVIMVWRKRLGCLRKYIQIKNWIFSGLWLFVCYVWRRTFRTGQENLNMINNTSNVNHWWMVPIVIQRSSNIFACIMYTNHRYECTYKYIYIFILWSQHSEWFLKNNY